MTALLVVLLAGVAVLAWRLWRLSRDLLRLHMALDERADARVDDRLHELWEQVGRLHGEHTWHVDAWMQRADQTATRLANGQGQLDQRLRTVEQWVRVWSGQAKG